MISLFFLSQWSFLLPTAICWSCWLAQKTSTNTAKTSTNMICDHSLVNPKFDGWRSVSLSDPQFSLLLGRSVLGGHLRHLFLQELLGCSIGVCCKEAWGFMIHRWFYKAEFTHFRYILPAKNGTIQSMGLTNGFVACATPVRPLVKFVVRVQESMLIDRNSPSMWAFVCT